MSSTPFRLALQDVRRRVAACYVAVADEQCIVGYYTLAATFYHVFVRQAAIQRDSDLDMLSQIHCPTLIIAAADDRLRSIEESQELMVGIPEAALVVIQDSGHMIPLEKPSELANILLEWLKCRG